MTRTATAESDFRAYVAENYDIPAEAVELELNVLSDMADEIKAFAERMAVLHAKLDAGRDMLCLTKKGIVRKRVDFDKGSVVDGVIGHMWINEETERVLWAYVEEGK